jgi:uncharacterized OsmC-like protein
MNAITTITPAEIVNGIDVNAVKGLVDIVAGDPARGHTSWKVTTAWQGQTWSRSTVAGFDMDGQHVARPFSLDIDEPLELGGGNRFANPQEYLLAALNACMTVGYVAQCSLRGIEIESLEIETTGDIDLRGFFGLSPDVAPGYTSVDYTVRIKGSATEAEFAEVHAAVIATSPNYHNVARPIALNPTLIVG